jgi:hypothetical protein
MALVAILDDRRDGKAPSSTTALGVERDSRRRVSGWREGHSALRQMSGRIVHGPGREF